uniref:Uncharacterized protein n=1 Tax=viral metagenome TaxID=1070528 RepID=A0A6C0CY86_9ZZZZ
MELIDYVNNNGIDSLKSDNIKINKFKNLKLVKYKYGSKLTNEYQKYCKGAIYNCETNNFVCIPPKNSELYNNQPLSKSVIIQDLIDGTMVNMFYVNDKWNISTRSDIGCNNKWSDKSFIKMINDICDINTITNVLNKNYSYSFVLRHKSNKCVSNIEFNSLVLVDIFDLSDNMYVTDMNAHFNINVPFYIINHYAYTNIERLMKLKCNHDWKGFIIKNNNIRYKYINPEYKKAKDITINSNNLLYTYFSCKHDNTIMKYLKIYPENKKDFDNYRDLFNIMVNEVYDNYVKFKIKKTIKFNDIPFHLKPLINNIHDQYIIKNKRISIKFISNYITKLPLKRIIFIMNNYIN